MDRHGGRRGWVAFWPEVPKCAIAGIGRFPHPKGAVIAGVRHHGMGPVEASGLRIRKRGILREGAVTDGAGAEDRQKRVSWLTAGVGL